MANERTDSHKSFSKSYAHTHTSTNTQRETDRQINQYKKLCIKIVLSDNPNYKIRNDVSIFIHN